jgi:hypothetical protein
VGWHFAFGPVENGNGKWHRGRPWRGAFIDLMTLAYLLDGDRGASYGEHRADFGLDAHELPLVAPCDTIGAGLVTEAVLGMHDFVVALDDAASCWFPHRASR